jgi:CheY-like chemotaxis protein
MSPLDVLIVDDNALDAELFQRAFTQTIPAVRIATINRGEEVLDFLNGTGKFNDDSTTAPGFILMDVHLAEMSGLEVLRKLKSSTRLCRIPVVMMSSSEDEELIGECYKASANGFILKPVSYDDFSAISMVVGPYWIRLNQSAFL